MTWSARAALHFFMPCLKDDHKIEHIRRIADEVEETSARVGDAARDMQRQGVAHTERLNRVTEHLQTYRGPNAAKSSAVRAATKTLLKRMSDD